MNTKVQLRWVLVAGICAIGTHAARAGVAATAADTWPVIAALATVMPATDPPGPQDAEDQPRPRRPRRGARDDGFGPMRPGGPADGPPDRPFPDRPPRPLTAKQIDETMSFIQEHFPIAHRLLSGLQMRNPRLFRRRLQHIAPRIMEMQRAVNDDPPIGRLLIADFRLESEIIELRHKYRLTDDAEKQAQIRNKLQDAIGKQFDVQIQRQKLTLNRLEKRLDAQRQRLDRQSDRRDQIVNDRLKDALTGPLDRPPSGPPDGPENEPADGPPMGDE